MQESRAQFAALYQVFRYASADSRLVIVCLSMVGHIGSQLAIPWIVGLIIDDVLVKGQAGLLLQRSLLLGVAATANVFFQGIYEVICTRWGAQALNVLQADMFAHLQEIPVDVLDCKQAGQLSALFTNDAQKIGTIYNPLFRETIYSCIQLSLILGFVGFRYGQLVLLAGLLIPLYVVFPMCFYRRTRLLSAEVQEIEAQVSSRLQETIGGIREIKAFGRQQWSKRQFEFILHEVVRCKIRISLLQSVYGLSYALYWTVLAGVYWYGGQQVFAGQISIGQLVALVTYFGFLYGPVSLLISVVNRVQVALGAVHRVLEFMLVPTEQNTNGHEVLTLEEAPSIEFSGVTFHYPTSHKLALDEVRLFVESGQRVAVVGPSGAGKSTLAQLLIRFRDPQSGRIYLDGRDIRSFGLNSVRSGIGIIFQDPFLFFGSIRDNIRFGRLEATDAEVEEAARLANAHDFILQMPDGYNTLVGERGSRLSAGQKQRLAIARLVLKKSRVLVLDEATSAVDAESDYRIHLSLERIREGKTFFVIAHRLTTILDADLIAVMDDGRIIASGKHEDLLGQCSLYRQLYELYFDTYSSRPLSRAS